MTTDTTRRSVRVEARTTRETLDAIRRAAQIEGRSVSDFVVQAAKEKADRAIVDTEIVRLSVDAQRRFAQMMARRAEPTPAAVALAEAHGELERTGRLPMASIPEPDGLAVGDGG